MSRQQLHDLLVELEHKRRQLDPISALEVQQLDELIESLEQQKLYPQELDSNSVLLSQLKEVALEYESQHPTLAATLKSIAQVFNSFRI